MRKTWQYQVLTRFNAEFPNDMVFSRLVYKLFKKYSEGFYVHVPEESRITNTQKIANMLPDISYILQLQTHGCTNTMENQLHFGIKMIRA